jgi:hypothetical protein
MRNRISGLIAPTIAFAIVAFAADITTDYNHRADFSKYHTYSWIGVHASDLWQDRIMQAVDTQLESKGWMKVPSGGDAAVAAVGKITEQDTLQTFYDGYPGWGWGGFGEATTTSIPEKVGNLTVDIFDGSSKQLVWRGQAANTLSSKPDKNEHKLDSSVQKMFDHFPPASKG